MDHAVAGDLDKALPLFHRAIELCPFDPEYHRSMGQAALELSLLEEAEDALLKCLRLDPKDWHGLSLLGTVHYNRGDLDLAGTLFGQSIMGHENAYALSNLGAVRGKQGHTEEAQQLFERALAIDPTHQPAVTGLALCRAGKM